MDQLHSKADLKTVKELEAEEQARRIHDEQPKTVPASLKDELLSHAK
jgi:hypothetical protein